MTVKINFKTVTATHDLLYTVYKERSAQTGDVTNLDNMYLCRTQHQICTAMKRQCKYSTITKLVAEEW